MTRFREMNDETLDHVSAHLARWIADATVAGEDPYSFHLEDYRAARAEQRVREARSQSYDAGFRTGWDLAQARA